MQSDSVKWKSLHGGYGVPYDPRPAIKSLEEGKTMSAAWEELWNELHHQGSVGEASYAAVPLLVHLHKRRRNLDWNLYALVAVIEIERHRKTNPPLPPQLTDAYCDAWSEIILLAIEDLRTAKEPEMVQSTLGVLALGKGSLKLGAVIMFLDRSEVDEILDEQYSWSELYDDTGQPVIALG